MSCGNLTHIKNLTKEVENPFYLYNLDQLQSILDQFKNLDGVKLWYAQKANPLSSILKKMKENNIAIDCASLGEVKQALKCGYNGNEIISTGPAKSKAYLMKLVGLGVNTFVLESINQVTWLNDVCGKKADILLRVQKTDWNYSGNNVLGGSKITQFGLEIEDWSKINISDYKNLNFLGFHIFQWGNILNKQDLFNIWREIFSCLPQWCEKIGVENCEVLDLGGGLGIPYSESEKSLEISEVLDFLKTQQKEYSLRSIWLELGRYLSGPIGSYATQIVDIKNVNNEKMLILEGGINHMIRGTLSGQYFPVSDFIEGNKTSFKIYGPLCTSLDYLGEHQLSENLSPGDWLVFNQCGAYGFSESMPLFLCHDLPSEIIIKDNQLEVIRESQCIDELLR